MNLPNEASVPPKAPPQARAQSRADWWNTARAYLVLGRVSNLPTVWSNCAAGYLLAGGGPWGRLLLLCLGATLVYTAGMFLNDAFDAEFDRRHRRERPIPAGTARLQSVWTGGWIGLLVGGAILIPLGKTVAIFAVLLVISVIIYDAIHKQTPLAPLIMASCRFLLYLCAAAAGIDGVTGWAVWSGLALACYIVGLSYLARRESLPGPLRYWPALLLGSPFLLAFFLNGPDFRVAGGMAVILLAWILYALRHTYWTRTRQVGRSISGLLAGIVLVDALAVSGPPGLLAILGGLFLLTLLLQRKIPAT